MYTVIPTPRLRNKAVGDDVILDIPRYEQVLKVQRIRDDGYYDLTYNGRLVITAAACHVIKG
jgi:hypothetical protein